MDDSAQEEQASAHSPQTRARWGLDYQQVVAQSLGERLLPVLMAAMDTCWIAAVLLGLASVGFFGSTAPALPLWAPFVFIAGVAWILSSYASVGSTRTSRRGVSTGPRFIVIGVVLVLTLLYCIWSGVYAATSAFFNPLWLLLLLNDILLLSPAILHALGIVVLVLLCAWRGRAISRYDIEPGTIFRALGFGMGMLLVTLFLETFAHTGSSYTGPLFLIIPLALAFALIAHSLANVALLRHTYTAGLSGSVKAQENALLASLVSICVALLLLTFVAAAVISPDFLGEVAQLLAPIGRAYDWLVNGLAQVLVFLLSPLFALLQHFRPHGPAQPVQIRTFNPPVIAPGKTNQSLADLIVGDILRVLLPLLILSLIVAIVVMIFRRRQRARKEQPQQEDHESIWSWQLFWAQLAALLQALKQRFFGKTAGEPVAQVIEQESIHEPAVRSIREIYRAMLQRASMRGYPRQKSETPHEFRGRVHAQMPEGDIALATVTTAYEGVRYGGNVPSDEEIEQVKGAWQHLQQQL